MQIHLLIVEDEPLVAAMIREALSGSKYAVRAIAFDKQSAEKYLDDDHFDAAILDIHLQQHNDGIEIGRLIRDKYHFPFIYLTAHADDRTIDNAKLTQPAGYIIKPFTERDLLAGLEIALYNARQQREQVTKLPTFDSVNEKLSEPLTRRELDMVQMLFEGRSNVDISQSLFISINTVKTHLSRLYAKLGASSRTEALARVRELL